LVSPSPVGFARPDQKLKEKNMKSKCLALFSKSLVFAALVAGLLPLTAGAQSPAAGKFTLPLEVHWGTATLPKGDYSFSFAPSGGSTLLFVRKEGSPSRSYMIGDVGWDEMAGTSSANRLVLGRLGDETYVKDLQLGCVGTVLHFRAPSFKERLLAKVPAPAAREPEPTPSEM
jgi:hypothetical protein